MKEYIKKFETPESANGYRIKDIPFITTVASTMQNLICDLEGRELVNDNGNVIIEKPIPNDEIWYTSSNGQIINPYRTTSLPTIVSNTYSDGEGVIKFTSNVTIIGSYAFHDCTGLTSVTIPNSVSSISDSVFSGCNSLTTVTIGNSVTSIGDFAFGSCYGLTSINIPNGVTDIGTYAFEDCYNLTSIKIPNSVTSIGENAFTGCKKLSSVTIPNSVTHIGYSAFFGCTGLTSLSVEVGNTAYDSRNDCNGIIETSTNTLISCCQNTTIPNSVTSIGRSVFWGYTNLTSIEIPNSVTHIGDNAFFGCTGLTSITIPNSVTSIGNYTFDGCTSLSSISYTGTKSQYNGITKGYGWHIEVPTTVVHCTDGDVNI